MDLVAHIKEYWPLLLSLGVILYGALRVLDVFLYVLLNWGQHRDLSKKNKAAVPLRIPDPPEHGAGLRAFVEVVVVFVTVAVAVMGFVVIDKATEFTLLFSSAVLAAFFTPITIFLYWLGKRAHTKLDREIKALTAEIKTRTSQAVLKQATRKTTAEIVDAVVEVYEEAQG